MSVAIELVEKGSGWTARCDDLHITAHAATEAEALRLLKEQLDAKFPGVRVHLAHAPELYTRTAVRSGDRHGVPLAVTAASHRSTNQ